MEAGKGLGREGRTAPHSTRDPKTPRVPFLRRFTSRFLPSRQQERPRSPQERSPNHQSSENSSTHIPQPRGRGPHLPLLFLKNQFLSRGAPKNPSARFSAASWGGRGREGGEKAASCVAVPGKPFPPPQNGDGKCRVSVATNIFVQGAACTPHVSPPKGAPHLDGSPPQIHPVKGGHNGAALPNTATSRWGQAWKSRPEEKARPFLFIYIYIFWPQKAPKATPRRLGAALGPVLTPLRGHPKRNHAGKDSLGMRDPALQSTQGAPKPVPHWPRGPFPIGKAGPSLP